MLGQKGWYARPRGRHARAILRQRKVLARLVTAYAAIILLVLAMPLAMLAMHGPAFFVFRQNGTGQSGDGAPAENAGPGQPMQPVTLAARMPNGRQVIVHSVLSDEPSWASVARDRHGNWVVVRSGRSYRAVSRATVLVFRPRLYESAWTMCPVEVP